MQVPASEIEDFCYDSGFEYVLVQDSDTIASAVVGEDKEGLDRILEALEATMWPSYQKPAPACKSPDAASESVENTDIVGTIKSQVIVALDCSALPLRTLEMVTATRPASHYLTRAFYHFHIVSQRLRNFS